MKWSFVQALWGFVIGSVGALFFAPVPFGALSFIWAVGSIFLLAIGSLMIINNWQMMDRLFGFLTSLFFWMIGALTVVVFVLPNL